MTRSVHPATISLRGDDRYNARITQIEYRIDGASIVSGVMKAGGPEGVKANPPLPDVLFRYTISASAMPADYWRINIETFCRLGDNQPLFVDFTPPLPPPTQNSRGGLLAGLVSCI